MSDCNEVAQFLQNLKYNQLFELKANLETKLSKAEDKVESLRDEKNFISQEKTNLAGQLSQMQEVMANI